MTLKTGVMAGAKSVSLRKPDRLAIFTFFWACQAAVQMEFFAKKWLPDDNLAGWALNGLIVLTMIFPGSIAVFSLMLITSVIYNVGWWPNVSNHILFDSIIHITMLFGIGYALLQSKIKPMSGSEVRNLIFDKFAPVVLMLVIAMYWFIVLSKTNWDFFNYGRSCVSDFYFDVTDRFGFLGLPNLDVNVSVLPVAISLWTFMVVEIAIPLLLMIRKTRYLALIIGVPFHLLLATIGHRSFSSFILALYVLIAADSLVVVFADAYKKIGAERVETFARAGRILLAVMAVGLFVLHIGGSSIPAMFFSYRYWYVLMFFGLLGLLILYSVLDQYRGSESEPVKLWTMAPKWVWLMTIPMFINGLSPYLGFKTETSFAMYSNMHTEGIYNNHVFMPKWNVASYQEDLVDILDTNHPKLRTWIEKIPLHDREEIMRKVNIVFFEFNRVIAETMDETPDIEFYVRYTRNNGMVQTFRSNDPGARDHELARLEPLWRRKLMYFRPVFAGELSYCQH